MRIYLSAVFILFGVLLHLPSTAQNSAGGRLQWGINDNWKFKPSGAEFVPTEKISDAAWQRVSIPHTWNAADPFDDDATYRRGVSWYRRRLTIGEDLKDKKIYLYFEGANQVTDVYLNGAFVGQHKGGYTAFSFDVTNLIKFGKDADNLLAVQVNNAQDNFIAPLSVGYAMYGGIYRDVWVVATSKLHFDMSDHASAGVFISTPKVSAQSAAVSIKGTVVNDGAQAQTFEVVNKIYNNKHQLITTLNQSLSVPAGKQGDFNLTSDEIKSPALWSPETPTLYTVVSQVTQNGKVVDELTNPLGFRWFSFNPSTGFSLNGKKYVLRGTNRHQDMQGKGSALTNEDHARDMRIIKDMGCNFLRLAHYPQSPEVLRLADKLGLLIWEEIPIVNNMNVDKAFLENGKDMIREMIRQHYNHPSVIIWGSMNEVLLWSKGSERIQVHDDTAYVNGVYRYAVKLDSTVRAEDPARYSTMAMHQSDDYEKYKFASIPKVAGWNIYCGWYSGKAEEFSQIYGDKHKAHPNEVILISEYGAESDKQVNSENPLRLDFSGQYQRLYHESYLRQMRNMPYLAGTAIWNEFDFSQPNVGGTISHMNHKGMVTWDRKPKDVYYLYKANWNPEPMVYIATRDWLKRGGKPGAESTIEIYANQPEVTLVINGKSYGSKKTDDIGKALWKVQLDKGNNIITATATKNGQSITDRVVVEYTVFDDNLNAADFTAIGVNVGANTQYIDDGNDIWINDQPYKKGAYGYIGGTPTMLGIKSLITYTNDTPLFYTYQDGIKTYRLDVPDGRYELELCMVEPAKTKSGDRVFGVSVNGYNVFPKIDLAADYGTGVAVKKKYIAEVKDGKGISVDFNAISGNAVLSGIKVKRLY
jgi:beta-galactosidase